MAGVRRRFDGCDTGVLVADDLAGRLLNQLADLGVDADTAVVLSPDHGEDLGELNVYVDHRAADQLTRACRSSCGGPASPAAASACGVGIRGIAICVLRRVRTAAVPMRAPYGIR